MTTTTRVSLRSHLYVDEIKFPRILFFSVFLSIRQSLFFIVIMIIVIPIPFSRRTFFFFIIFFVLFPFLLRFIFQISITSCMLLPLAYIFLYILCLSNMFAFSSFFFFCFQFLLFINCSCNRFVCNHHFDDWNVFACPKAKLKFRYFIIISPFHSILLTLFDSLLRKRCNIIKCVLDFSLLFALVLLFFALPFSECHQIIIVFRQ